MSLSLVIADCQQVQVWSSEIVRFAADSCSRCVIVIKVEAGRRKCQLNDMHHLFSVVSDENRVELRRNRKVVFQVVALKVIASEEHITISIVLALKTKFNWRRGLTYSNHREILFEL